VNHSPRRNLPNRGEHTELPVRRFALMPGEGAVEAGDVLGRVAARGRDEEDARAFAAGEREPAVEAGIARLHAEAAAEGCDAFHLAIVTPSVSERPGGMGGAQTLPPRPVTHARGDRLRASHAAVAAARSSARHGGPAFLPRALIASFAGPSSFRGSRGRRRRSAAPRPRARAGTAPPRRRARECAHCRCARGPSAASRRRRSRGGAASAAASTRPSARSCSTCAPRTRRKRVQSWRD